MKEALTADHKRQLVESGISKKVRRGRGYRSIQSRGELAALGYGAAQQRVPGLLVPIWGVDGRKAGSQYRSSKPRVDAKGRPVKYETPEGSTAVLDVPPSARAALADSDVPLWITEGAKKADAAVTAGLCCIALIGVWGWKSAGRPLQD
ncbi:DUF3854 domain-containing protein, partial [Aeromicrobium alkaliterrae]